MQKRIIDFQIKGMRRDLSISKADPNYAYEIINMRLTPSDNENLLSLVNEKGNSKILLTTDNETTFSFGEVKYIGHCVINQYLVLFLLKYVNNYWSSVIYRIDFNDSVYINNEEHYKIKLIFGSSQADDLQFSESHLIETIGDYETDKCIKVYFTDGINQPRVINILRDYLHTDPTNHYNTDELNFTRSLKIGDDLATVTITKELSPGALFSGGVIQYCLSYYSTNLQESNIFYTSPLYYISPASRGAAADETVGNAFTIKIDNPDISYEYIRIYSIRRTSLEGTPIVKRVVDMPVIDSSNSIIFTDNNTTGEEIDPTILYYIGGDVISAETFEAKDNTLFLGNIRLLRQLPKTNNVVWTVKENPLRTEAATDNFWGVSQKEISVNSGGNSSVTNTSYNYEPTLGGNSSQVTVFKTGDVYRLGFQLQHSSGVWTDAYWLKDYTVTSVPSSNQIRTIFNDITFTPTGISDLISSLNSLGYKAIRPVVVYPKSSDRNVLCQGMVCPTVYNIKDRYDNTVYAQASWFARPMSTSSQDYDMYSAGVEFRHNHALHTITSVYNNDKHGYGNEIQSMDVYVGDTIHTPDYWRNGQVMQSYADYYTDYYFVDNAVVTLNTPELDFDESFMLDADSSYTFKIVGAIPINITTSDINILASAPFEGDDCYVPTKKNGSAYNTIKLGAVNKRFSISNNGRGWMHSPIYQQWIDRKAVDLGRRIQGDDNDMYNYKVMGVYLSPWHKTGQFIPTQKRAGVMEKHLSYMDPQYDASKLKNKKLSHLQFSYNTAFISTPWCPNNYSPAIITYNSDEPTASRIKVSEFAFGRYYGNIDKVLVPGSDNGGNYGVSVTTQKFDFDARQDYPDSTDLLNVHTIPFIGNQNYATNINTAYEYMMDNSFTTPEVLTYKSSDPIRIKYKSTPHLVISLQPELGQGDQNDPIKRIIPHIYGCTSNVETDKSIESTISAPYLMGAGGYLLLGEIWNTSVDDTNRFGGQTEEALISNNWVVAGNAQPLSGSSFTLTWDRGDTYYQRYDCLKTYPYTLEDENSIVEVVSFMCETRINIDGRYDKNRGTASLVAHPTNFNLLNPIYSQRDNFFNYRGFNSRNDIELFPNQITWTVTKSPNSEIDKWTNITLASTLNLDGDKGEIKRIEKFRNELFAFQERGISRILFNDRTALSTTNGLPVELANSGRVEGKMYFTELEGLTNKVSIKTTPNGIYFIDGKTKTAYLFNGQQCLSLSDTKAMKIFFTGQPDNFRIFYDSKEKDVYFVNSNYCLCYSEKLGEFAGFFSYENVPLMENVKDKFLSLYNNDIWEHYVGNYNSFYGIIKPHSITFIGNDNLPFDKIYTNLEFISDSFFNNEYVSTKTFDHLKVWNEYQTGEESLVDTNGRPSNLKKKFRIWRAHLPRANWNGRDRIRNPWCFVQLRMDNPSIYKTILHKVNLEYYI